MLLRRKVAFVCTRETDSQEDRTYNDVKAVKSGRHIEGRAVIQPTKRKWCDGIFVRLNSTEQHPEKDGQPKAFFKTLAVSMDKRVVCPCNRRTRAQQYERIEQWKLHRVEDFEALWRPLHQGCSAFLTNQVGHCECVSLSIFDDFQRHWKQGIIKPCPEPSHEEHDFGSNEHDHAVTQMQLHDWRMVARLRFMDDIAPPSIEGVNHTNGADPKDEATVTKLLGMHPHHQAEKHREGRKRAQQRRDAWWQNMIIVIFGTRHGQFPAVLSINKMS